jgi:hypothetical protein
MKKGLVIVGIILLVVGLLMMLFMWPLIGTKTWEEMQDEEPKDGETYKIIGEITDEGTFMGITVYEIDDGDGAWFADSDEFNKGDTVIVEYTYDEDKLSDIENMSDPMDMLSALDAKMYKVPTPLGIIGLILLIIGVILLIVGAVTSKAAPAPPPEQPPMGQPPMQDPYQQPPPGQPYQPPPQQPPPQQPYQPPPP